MNGEQHRLHTEQLIRSLLKGRALIRREAGAALWPAYRGGDRRTRALFWVNSADVEDLIRDGVLVVTDRGVDLAPPTRRRLLYGQSAREVVERTEYVRGGAERPVRRNVRGSVVLRLARRQDRDGTPLLSDAQITAAHRYTADLMRAGEGRIGTSDVAAPRVDGTRRHDAAEDAAIARIDGSRSLRAARQMLGARMSRLLNAVCGANERLEAIERAEDWSRGTGLTVLRIALDRLVVHYGTVPGEASPVDALPVDAPPVDVPQALAQRRAG
ncbi:DUF6456 domain-containing protein [uncultured Algimonas sp.]|uniref:DUF6456 domain-containing protein n=1 Tax=uncultured Algimonas sp. TaxID=1547920 RepID=UPI002628507A|nr:DUF6456 domain-containing protein [uncultured Algimonas sp.]